MTLFQNKPVLRKIAIASSVVLWGLFALWMGYQWGHPAEQSELSVRQVERPVEIFVSSSVSYPSTTIEMTEVQMVDGQVIYMSTTTRLLQ